MKKKASTVRTASTTERITISQKTVSAAAADALYQIQISDFKSKSAGPLIRFLQSLLSNINGDERFANMSPRQTDMSLALDELVQASGVSQTIKSRQNTNTTAAKLLLCKDQLVKLSEWLVSTYPEDDAPAKIAGFKLYKTSRNRITPVPDMLQMTRLTPSGDPSAIYGACEAVIVTGKIMYTSEISEDDGKTWRNGGSSSNSRRIPVTGLRKTTAYRVRFYATTTGGNSVPSFPALSWVGQ